jgi:hypothetical protein
MKRSVHQLSLSFVTACMFLTSVAAGEELTPNKPVQAVQSQPSAETTQTDELKDAKARIRQLGEQVQQLTKEIDRLKADLATAHDRLSKINDQRESKSDSVRIRFDPNAAEGRTCSTALLPPKYAGGKELLAVTHLQIGKYVPIREESGPTIFKMHFVSGNDDKIRLDITHGDARKILTLVRDQPVDITVDGRVFQLAYPSSYRSTNKTVVENSISIFVTHRLEKPQNIES